MAILPVLTLPNPILTKKSTPVEKVDNELRKFMDDMLESMYHDQGIGLAAPQVGVNKRIIVIDLQDRAEHSGVIFAVNPEVIWASDELKTEEEGCLSLPGQGVKVTRPAEIKVQFLDYHGESKEMQAGGLLARAFQHEIDHLDGVLLADYVSKLKKDVMIRKLIKIQKRRAL